MENGKVCHVVFLFILNFIFMVAGIFLNSVVILSLRRSRQLRTQLCYFMILVLSCFDLAVASITHPFLIASIICYSLGDVSGILEHTRTFVSNMLCGFSMTALLALTAERFFALNCPYFHRASVTKTRLGYLQAILAIIIIAVSSLIMINTQTAVASTIFVAVFILLLLFLLVYGNYKMFIIAKSKRRDGRIGLSTPTSAKSNGKRSNGRILNLKSISTCSLAVGCFFVCCCPQIVFAILRFTSETPSYETHSLLLFLYWANTFVFINSTLNTIIFFWRNSILHREGMKIVNAFLNSRH